jgi:hypothetical protein
MAALVSALLIEGGFFHAFCPIRSPGDFRVTYHGTITTITPLSDACRDWLEDNVAIEPWQRFGTSIAIEPRYVERGTEAMFEAGLVMERDDPSAQH